MSYIVELKGVKKVFNEGQIDEFCAFKDVSFGVKKGEQFVIKGVSGSGKSTILSLIAGIYKPTSGDVLVKNEDITKLTLKFASRFRRQNIGMIFQSFNLIPTLSVFDNILLPTIVDRVDETFINKRAKKLLKEFDLESKALLKTRFLSGGEQQRVAIARALIRDPDVILADEPTANLDAKLSKNLLDYFDKIILDGKTIIIASHDPLILQSQSISGVYELLKR